MRKLPVKTSVIVIAVLILLIFLHYTKILLPIEYLSLKLLAPIEGKIYGLSKLNSQKYQENQEKINQLIVENSKLKYLRDENEVLRKKLGFLENQSDKFIMAQIIGKDPMSNVFILNKGKNDDIKTGLPVIVNEGILVGKIIETEANISKILFLTDSKSKWAARLQNKDNPSGLVEGELGLSLKIDLVPQNKLITPGDLVITSGLEENVPAGLIIGQVEKITTESHDLFQSATLKLLTPIDNLSLVAILISKNIP